VKQENLGLVVGKGGSNLQAMEKQFNVAITTPRKEETAAELKDILIVEAYSLQSIHLLRQELEKKKKKKRLLQQDEQSDEKSESQDYTWKVSLRIKGGNGE